MTGLKSTFNALAFLVKAGVGRRIVYLAPGEALFNQGDSADAVFYLQQGYAKVTVVSLVGKQATVALLSAGDFAGEESIAKVTGSRVATASAITACTAVKISKGEMLRLLDEEPSFANLFIEFLLARSIRTQADLVDQLFNCSEKRLARILLLMAHFGQQGEYEPLIPRITQANLADMVGTTRSRISFFMNRFRQHGFLEYGSRIRVNESLVNVVLLDELPQHDAGRASPLHSLSSPPQTTRKGAAVVANGNAFTTERLM
jgi:CRP/FNR family cyclic AMP-dependent transcriptional regulator